MKKLLTTIFALVFIFITGVYSIHAGTAEQESYGCATLGIYFHKGTAARDQGVSMKEVLENLAKKTQEIKIADSERTQYMSYALIVITNIYQNPLYKALGPEMNKMLAESRCNRIGTQSFMTELLESMP